MATVSSASIVLSAVGSMVRVALAEPAAKEMVLAVPGVALAYVQEGEAKPHTLNW